MRRQICVGTDESAETVKLWQVASPRSARCPMSSLAGAPGISYFPAVSLGIYYLESQVGGPASPSQRLCTGAHICFPPEHFKTSLPSTGHPPQTFPHSPRGLLRAESREHISEVRKAGPGQPNAGHRGCLRHTSRSWLCFCPTGSTACTTAFSICASDPEVHTSGQPSTVQCPLVPTAILLAKAKCPSVLVILQLLMPHRS